MQNKKILMIEIAGKGGICHYTYNLAQALARHSRVFVATGEYYEFEDKPKDFSVIKVFNRLKTNPLRVLWLVNRCAQSRYWCSACAIKSVSDFCIDALLFD